MTEETYEGATAPSRGGTRQALFLSRSRVGAYALILVITILFMAPFIWTVLTSLKSGPETFIYPPAWLPERFRWENYAIVFARVPYGAWTINSTAVALLEVVGTTTTATIVAYGFARFRFPGRDLLFGLTLATLILPAEVTMIPRFLLFRYLGWLDTLLPLVVPSFFGGSAFYIFLLRQFFLALPRDMDEAARMDGAGALRILTDIIAPLSKPALATTAILTFLASWGEFLNPLIYLNSTERLTLPVGLRYFQVHPDTGGEPTTQLLMAASLMMTVPCIVLFFLGQRYFVQGVVMSGLKG